MTIRHATPKGNGRSPAIQTFGRVLAWGLTAAAWGWSAGATRADSLVPAGKPAPNLALATLDGQTVQLADLRGQTVLLLFGELYNRNSVDAAKDVAEVLSRPEMVEVKACAYLVITQKAPAAELLAAAQQKGLTLPVLHDVDRRAFADYRVTVLPSLIIVDANGVTALPCAGYPLDFRDLVTDTLLFTAGRLSDQEFNRRRTATPESALPAAQARALRIAALAAELVRRGSQELAISSFRQALTLYPDCVPARVGLGNCLLNRRELPEAETQFRHVLKTAPGSTGAALGLIHIQIIRGGDELEAADERLRGLLRVRPTDSRVVYLSGLVAEKSGDASAALGHYKRAAELLLYGQERRWEAK